MPVGSRYQSAAVGTQSGPMSLGKTPRQRDLFGSTITSFYATLIPETSIYGLLHRDCFTLFPDELFADLFADIGRCSVPPLIVAVVMVLQRLEGLSDRDAVDRFVFDVRWKYAAGGLDFEYPGFVHTVLVDMRARLAASDKPDRIFEVTTAVGREAGLHGRRRVVDSSPIYDAVATMDTVTLVRSAIRGLLAAAGALETELRAVLRRDDDYASAGKPVCDYDDRLAREALVDALANDAQALLVTLEGRKLSVALAEAAALLAAVVGQDLDEGEDGLFRIARRVAKDRIISTVDPQARHGRKTSANGYDGYKGHLAMDPDSELITATAVTPANSGDAAVVAELLAEDLPVAGAVEQTSPESRAVTTVQPAAATQAEQEPHSVADAVAEPTDKSAASTVTDSDARDATELADQDDRPAPREPLIVYGDAAYGAGKVLDVLHTAGAENRCKVQPPIAAAGHFTKDAFAIDLAARTVTCPAGQTAPLQASGQNFMASFGEACATCSLAAHCTTAKTGRTISVGPYEELLVAARAEQTDPAWRADYRATRPKVERKIAHLMRRHHGGRRARVRGQPKVAADFALRAAAVNLARLAVLGVVAVGRTWAVRAA